MKTLGQELEQLFSTGITLTAEQVVEELGYRYTLDEVEDELANLSHSIALTATWYPKSDKEVFEKYDGKLD